MNQGQQSHWRPTRRQVLWTVGIVVAIVVASSIVLGYVLEWEWTGLVKDKAYTKRTLWDWLQLLIIPAVLAGVGLWFNRQQREQELQTADSRAQDEALQAYLDQMSDMLIPPSKDLPSLYKARPGDSLSSVARARTLTVLPRLDGVRKARVVQFLYESGLIARGRPILDLDGADLRGADLQGAHLSGADLQGAHLSGANLSWAVLQEANLSWAVLQEANLSGANLGWANLDFANLSGANLGNAVLYNAHLLNADLRGADLRGADLSGADLQGAHLSRALLDFADLRGVQGWTEEQLSEVLSRTEAIMPDGQKCEDWFKNKGRKEEQENSSP